MEKNTALEALILAVKQRKEIEADLRTVVAYLRREGMPWSELALYLGISKQGAQQKYGKDSSAALTAADRMEDEAAPRTYAEGRTTATVQTPSGPVELGPEDFGNASIFSDAAAPAKPVKASRKVAAAAPAKELPIYLQPGMVHAVTADWDKHEQDSSYPAQPGTGKGPHECPRCERTNHHGTARFTITFFPECTPTRYDPPATVDAMADWQARAKA